MAERREKVVKRRKIVGGISGVMNRIDENAPEYCSPASFLAELREVLGEENVVLR